MSEVGTTSRPLRVAIIGAGPAGFYTAEHLQKREGITVAIDMYDRLATPYGLVRLGVAPDHEKIKSVTKVYERIAGRPGFRFFGCVEIGRDVTDADLADHYDAIVLTVGAPVDRRMGIPGEDLAGSHSATDFVAWYNAHPDHHDLTVDLGIQDVVVVGNGNVAVDVARILATDAQELAHTDIADHALEILRTSAVRTVTMLGRPIRRSRPVPKLCSAKNTATKCACFPWGPILRPKRPIRSNCAAAPMSIAWAISAFSPSWRKARWPPGCAASRR